MARRMVRLKPYAKPSYIELIPSVLALYLWHMT